MSSRLPRLGARVLAIVVCTGLAAAADLESAKRAYEQKDYTTAAREYTALAQLGNAPAQFALGRMYMMGQGVKQDREEAIKWFKAAATKGNADAEFFLGAMYLLPQKDIGEGIRWLRLSAAQGMQDAQYLLGKTYMQGAPELPRDPVQGAMWLRLAAKDNKDFYQGELNSAEKQMSADQVAKAKTLAAEWKPTLASKH